MKLGTDGAVPIKVLANRLNRSVRTLKRWHQDGCLPVLILAGQWVIPESFLIMLFSSPKPGRAGVLKEVAAAWFATYGSTR